MTEDDPRRRRERAADAAADAAANAAAEAALAALVAVADDRGVSLDAAYRAASRSSTAARSPSGSVSIRSR